MPLLDSQDTSQIELPEARRRRPCLIIEISGNSNHLGMLFQNGREMLDAFGFEDNVVVKHQKILTACNFNSRHSLTHSVRWVNGDLSYNEALPLPFRIRRKLRGFGILACIGNDDLINAARLTRKGLKQCTQRLRPSNGWHNSANSP